VPDATRPGGGGVGVGLRLTVNGTGFVATSVVKWNGSARTTTFVSGSQLKATILGSDIAAPGTASVTVVNPTPGGGTSNVVFFEVTPPSSSIALSRADYPTGSNPHVIVAGDFNGDGRMDLVTGDVTANTVSVFLGNGDGTFQQRTPFATSGPVELNIGDFNRDGKIDLAVADQYGSTVSILLGNGDGTFQAAVEYPTGANAASVSEGDFNGDGTLDLAVTNILDNTVSILLGNGDGTFQPQITYATGERPFPSVTGDFNGDGKLDLAIGNQNGNSVSILLGNGDGTFQTQTTYAAGNQVYAITTADLNGDGKLDLIVANNADSTISVLLNNGDGTFQNQVTYPTGYAPHSVTTGDFNGDGKLDLATANDGDNSVSILLGNGDGTFQAPVNYGAGGFPAAVAIGDFNRDGRLDLAVANYHANTVSVLLQAPTVSLSNTSLTFAGQVVGTGSAPQTVTLTDTGYLPLRISSIAVTGADAADFTQTNNCGSSLPAGAHCTITVTFMPTQIGPRTAAVTITDNAAGSPQSVALSGTGVTSGPNVTLSATSLTFATQLVGTSSTPQSVTLTNYGTMMLDISSIIPSGDFSQSNTCGSSLAPLASCTISVTFTPTQGGTRSGTLSITDNAPGSPQRVSLTGVGTVVKLNPASLNFGTVTVGQRKPLTTIMTNVGSTTLSITSITISGEYFSQTNNCGSSLGAQLSCNITVTFAPQSGGTFTGAVSISDNGGGSPQQVSLSGTGGCSGSCSRGCSRGCGCNPYFHICLPRGELLNELFYEWNPVASFACGGD
jgi:hypothetical protein